MYQFATYLTKPFVFFLLLLGLAIVVAWYRRRESRKQLLCITLPYVMMIVLCMPAVAYVLLGSLEWSHPPLEDRPADVEAIVILGTGVLPTSHKRAQYRPDPSGIYRCLHAAALYHRGEPCTLFICAGDPAPYPHAPPGGVVMQEFLLQLDIDKSHIVVDSSSRTTYENAVECRKMIERRGVDRLVLVTDAMHLPRAMKCFEKQGINVVASGCQYRATGYRNSVYNFLPDLGAAQTCSLVAHEWLGILWYWALDRI